MVGVRISGVIEGQLIYLIGYDIGHNLMDDMRIPDNIGRQY